jgi:cobalt-precorrin 5A hydrolase/precorrin-3B C17-methyltransferase
VQVIQETGTTLWQNHLPSGHSFDFSSSGSESTAQVWISAAKRSLSSQSNLLMVQWHPRVLWVGIGCERGTSKNLIETGIEGVCLQYNLAPEAIAGLATIDIKADERGILQLCQELNWPIQTFTAAELSQIQVPHPSTIVHQEVGTPSVAEAAALLKAREQGSRGAEEPILLVPKQVIKQEGEKGALTVAIAQSTVEHTGREGKIYLVGMGPGSLAQITPAAKTAMAQADAVIGYGLYIELISPLLRPGQIVESFPITQEKQRGERAIALAQWGLTVAVVSSGDCGIYGMAGLVLEQLTKRGWDGKTPAVEVFPGITAMQAAAAKVGAPLMYDFCAISLSDLLTPWEVIEKRLIAAARADFVTAIYNPRSQTRTRQIIKTQEIFLQYRDANTPVAIVNSVYREDEQITLTTLEKMLNFPVDMLTTLIIGNSSTKQHQNWLFTPRTAVSLIKGK